MHVSGSSCDPIPGIDRQDRPLTGMFLSVKWDTTGLAIYFFQRGSIPEDLVAEKPQPDTWGRAQARWPAVGCDPWKYFFDHHMIFDTTLWYVFVPKPDTFVLIPYCSGDWAGAVWNGAGVPGQEESCAARTGFATCDEFVRARGDAFNNACELPSPPFIYKGAHFRKIGKYEVSNYTSCGTTDDDIHENKSPQ